MPDDELLLRWAYWHNYGELEGGWSKNQPRMEPPAEFNINVLNDHGRITRAAGNPDRIYLTCLICQKPLGSVGIPMGHVGQAIGSAKRGLRKHLLKGHQVSDPYA